MRFNQTCIAWVDTTACSKAVATSWKTMCLFFAAATGVVGLFVIAAVLRRMYLLNRHNMLFKILAPQLLIWVPLQFFYTVVHGASPNNFFIPTPLITLVHLQSSMILGNIIPQLIVTWSENYQAHHNLLGKHYQRYYWLAIIVFSIITGVISGLAGVNPAYYNACMRTLFAVWITYLTICTCMLLFFGIRNYHILLASLKASTAGNEPVLTAMKQIASVFVLCGLIFLPVTGLFLYYAIDIVKVEASKVISLIIWSIFNTCSTLFVIFWGIFIWVNTSTLVQRQNEEHSSSASTNTHDSKMESKSSERYLASNNAHPVV